MKSMYSQSKSVESKRHRITESISYVIDGEQTDEASEPAKFRHLMMKVELLVNAYGLAGCFIPKKDSPSSSVVPSTKIYCEWPQVMKFYRDIRNRVEPLLDTCSEASTMDYFIRVEEDFRQKALEHVRINPDVPLGEALLFVADKYVNVYYEHSAVLINKREGASSSSQNKTAAAGVPPKAEILAKAGQDSPQKGRPATVNETTAGKAICKKYNDRRGCEGKCRDGKVHVCDVLLMSQKPCEGKHSRMQHDPRKHGAPATKH